MQIKKIIQAVLDNNESLCMDSEEDKDVLLNKLATALEDYKCKS
tara:strand:- start:829 stop:960 length:132 start_codon:yes stop_codon:yes gene_type:complete